MKKKQILAIGVILFFLIANSLFAGGQQARGTTDSLADAGFNPTGLPIVSRPFTFSAIVSRQPMHGPFSLMTSLINMENRTGVTVEYIELPSQGFTERKNLILASHDLPDVFISGITDPDILRYGPLGTFIPLEGMIERYGPNLRDLFARRPDVRQFLTTPQGHIYTLPRINELAHRVNPDNWFINQTWLNTLGLRIPTTLDELQIVLRAFRDRDPNGNGRRDEIPLSFVGSSVGGSRDIASLFATFGMHDVPNHVMVRNRQVYFTANSPEFRNALVYFNMLYSEGLIDTEAFTHTGAQYTAKGNNPEIIIGSFFDWFDENGVGVERAVNHYVVVPPLVGVDGRRRWNTDIGALMERPHFAITSSMRHPEIALRWADVIFDREISLEIGFGTWGICLLMDGDNIIQVAPPPGMSQDEFRYQHAPAPAFPWAVMEADLRRMNLANNHVRKFERLEVYRPFFPAHEEMFPRVFFLQEEEAELVIIRNDIVNYVSQMRARFITGTESITTGWNTYVNNLNQMGLARYLELHQRALNRFYAN
jgi:putative aldouronate transport system substrate-binding protein